MFPTYKIYWLLKPHCDKAKKVKVVGGEIVYVCQHDLQILKKPEHYARLLASHSKTNLDRTTSQLTNHR